MDIIKLENIRSIKRLEFQVPSCRLRYDLFECLAECALEKTSTYNHYKEIFKHVFNRR